MRAALGRPSAWWPPYLLTWLTVSVVQAVLLYFLKYWLAMEGERHDFAVIL